MSASARGLNVARPGVAQVRRDATPRRAVLSPPAPRQERAGSDTATPAPRPAFDPADFDRLLRARTMRMTVGRSPVSLYTAFADWAGHLAFAPSVQWRLAQEAGETVGRFWRYAAACAFGNPPPEDCCLEPLPQDKRFADPAWTDRPFNLIEHAFLAQQQWWDAAIASVPGVSRHHRDVVSFTVRQWLDQAAPSNFAATNPVVLRETMRTGGRNLWTGWKNLIEDMERQVLHKPPAGAERFVPGKTVAVTPGKVVYRNELIELIQYEPTTGEVHPEPVLIVPAWIMKYYILDLSPENSLIRHLVDSGFTVLAVSWRNPGPEQRDLGLDDYLKLGVHAALDATRAIIPEQRVHAVGYCLGGTLLSIAAAVLGRRCDPCLVSLTLLAAQTDFTDAGELTLFIDDSEITFLEDMMWLQGVLDSRQMAGAFHLLRSNDLIWSRVVRDYLLGGRAQVTDLVAWSTDATRMPYRMHSEYLRRMFLDNDLAAGRYVVDGTPVGLSNICAPMFVVGAAWDHIAPWKSVYKVHLQADSDVTFVLTSGGHNAGIVNPPPGALREYRIGEHGHGDAYVSPDHWFEAHAPQQGSWWTPWVEWLRKRSSSPVDSPPMGAPLRGFPPLADAPGVYVRER